MARTPTAQAGADRWAQQLGSAGDKIKQGVMAVTVSPTAKAAAQKQRYVSGVQNAANSGRWERGLARVSTADWQNATINKGIPRISDGAQKAKGKYQAFAAQWYPIMASASQQVESMPKGTTEDALNRVRVIIEAGKQFKQNGG